MQPPLDAIEQVLSTERIEAFRRSGDTDMDVVARYAWNMALCAALYPVLHALEVVFRNRLFAVVEAGYAKDSRSFNDVECWLDCDPPLLLDGDLSLVSEPKQTLVNQGKDLTVGRLVA